MLKTIDWMKVSVLTTLSELLAILWQLVMNPEAPVENENNITETLNESEQVN